jgi:hypothetical protein
MVAKYGLIAGVILREVWGAHLPTQLSRKVELLPFKFKFKFKFKFIIIIATLGNQIYKRRCGGSSSRRFFSTLLPDHKRVRKRQ